MKISEMPTYAGDTSGVWAPVVINGNKKIDFKLAVQLIVQAAIAELINGAPELLNTLKELADKITADEGAATTLATLVGQKLNTSAFTGVAVKGLLEALTGNARIDISAIKGSVPDNQLPNNRFTQFTQTDIVENGETVHLQQIKVGGVVLDFADLVARMVALEGGNPGGGGGVTPPPTNLLTSHSAFDDTAVWSTQNLLVGVNAVAAADGTTTMEKLVASADSNGGGDHILYQIKSGLTIGSTHPVSLEAKAAEFSRIQVALKNYSFAIKGALTVNLSDGTYTVSGAPTNIAVVSKGTGHWGISFDAQVDTELNIFNITVLNNAGESVYAGDGTSGLYATKALLG